MAPQARGEVAHAAQKSAVSSPIGKTVAGEETEGGKNTDETATIDHDAETDDAATISDAADTVADELPPHAVPANDAIISPGSRIGRFLVVEPLGEGGMGTVVAAYDPDLDRRVAIKLLRSEAWGGGSSSQSRERLIREARAMAKLSHPNVLTVHEVGMVGDRVFVAMEFAAGGTLTKWLFSVPVNEHGAGLEIT